MKHFSHYILFGCLLLTLLSLSSCETQRKLMKTGHQQVELQMYEEAANTYLRALAKKKSNLEAQVAVRNTLALVFENKTDRIEEAFSSNQLEQLIAEYKNIQRLSQQAKALGVLMDIPLKAEKLFVQSRDIVTNEKNALAQTHVKKRNYALALQLFNEVLAFNPSNDEARAGVTTATNEPILENGTRLYEEGKFRAAYRLLKPIEKYKETKELVALALEKGTCTMLIIPSYQTSPAEYHLTAEYLRRNNNSPFLKLIFYSEAISKIEEYGCSYNDLLRASPRIRALADLGKIDCLLQLSPLNINVQKPRLQQQQLKGYNVVITEQKDEHGIPQKKEEITKVYYTLVTTALEQKVRGTLYARVVNTRNSAVLFERDFVKERSDRVEYIDYNGKITNLRAGSWKGKAGEPFNAEKGDVMHSSSHTLSTQIVSLRNARKSFRDIEADKRSLSNELNMELTATIVALTNND